MSSKNEHDVHRGAFYFKHDQYYFIWVDPKFPFASFQIPVRFCPLCGFLLNPDVDLAQRF
jgi:hypothetical protein